MPESMTMTIEAPAAHGKQADRIAANAEVKLRTTSLKSSDKLKAPVPKSKIEPLRALEPARKKLCMLESQRIMSVFDDTLKRTEIITLMPFILENLDRFGVCFGADLLELLHNHNSLQETYIEIREQLHELKHTENVNVDPNLDLEEQAIPQPRSDSIEAEQEKTDLGIIKASSATSIINPVTMVLKQLSIVAEKLSSSCKNILRFFMSNPAAVKAVIAEYSNRAENCEIFRVNLNELKEILLHKLLTTPIEAKEKQDYLQEIALREKQNKQTIAKLEADLATNTDEKDEEIKKRNDIIRKLQADLHQIERLSDESIRRMKSDSDKQQENDTKNSEARQQKMLSDKSQRQTHLQGLKDEHKESESNLRKKKFKIETEVENWIQKYDMDMGERQDEYEEIDAIYTEEKKQLHELEERFKTLEIEYNEIIEARRRDREERERAEREMHLMIRCATTIQAFWRSFKVRKMLKMKKKGKGKGKKKK